MESRNWYVIGYKNSKGKKPRRFDAWRFQELVTRDEALRRLQTAYPFSIITDVAPRRDDTKLDNVLEFAKGEWNYLFGIGLCASAWIVGLTFGVTHWTIIAFVTLFLSGLYFLALYRTPPTL